MKLKKKSIHVFLISSLIPNLNELISVKHLSAHYRLATISFPVHQWCITTLAGLGQGWNGHSEYVCGPDSGTVASVISLEGSPRYLSEQKAGGTHEVMARRINTYPGYGLRYIFHDFKWPIMLYSTDKKP